MLLDWICVQPQRWSCTLVRLRWCPQIWPSQCLLVLMDELPHEVVKPVRTPVAIFGSLGVCIYVPTSRHWLISYSPIHLT